MDSKNITINKWPWDLRKRKRKMAMGHTSQRAKGMSKAKGNIDISASPCKFESKAIRQTKLIGGGENGMPALYSNDLLMFYYAYTAVHVHGSKQSRPSTSWASSG
jgi:hypothetical protein